MTTHLFARLEQIGRGLEADQDALALIGLGSVGRERERVDEYSDLDFFVIVRPGAKARYVAALDWLAAAHPLAFAFQNTVDGWKALFADGIFCEFAVFAPGELAAIPFTAGRVVWKRPEVEADIAIPACATAARPAQPVEWLVGEALTNLYVGLGRYLRGEKLSAARFIQGYAVDRIVELAGLVEAERPAHADPFDLNRRFEARYPGLAAWLPRFLGGYAACPQSATAILEFLERHFAVNPAMAQAIRALAARAEGGHA